MISLRRMTLGSGYRYLMESVAVGDGAPGHSLQPDPLLRRVGDPARRVLGRRPGRSRRRPRGRAGSAVTEQHLFNLLGMCADPITGKALGRQPNRAHLSLAKRVAQRVAAIPAHPHRRRTGRGDGPHRGRGTGQGRHLPYARGRVRPDLLAVEVGLVGLGAGRPGDQGTDLRLPSPRHRGRAHLRRARGVPLALGHQRRGPRRRRRRRGRRLHPLGFEGRGSPAPRPCGGGQPRPLGLRRHVAHARFAGPVQVRRRSLRAAPGRAQRPVDRGVGVGLGRSGSPPLRAAPLRSDRGARGPDGRVLAALGRHRGAQDTS